MTSLLLASVLRCAETIWFSDGPGSDAVNSDFWEVLFATSAKGAVDSRVAVTERSCRLFDPLAL